MGNSSRKNEILAGNYRISMATDTIPTFTIGTINKDILIDGHFTFPIMMQSPWEIANICDMKSGKQWIGLHRLHNQFGKHQELFPLKSVFQFNHIDMFLRLTANIHNKNEIRKQNRKIVHIQNKTFYFSVRW